MSKTNNPCYLCEDRYPGCHGKCEEYLEFQHKRVEQLRERKRRLEKETDYLVARKRMPYEKK